MNFVFTPSLDPTAAAENLEKLVVREIDPVPFASPIRRLKKMFDAYAASAPLPWPAGRLILTPEAHYQSELWLPLSLITPVFQRFFKAALTYPPVFSSTPFATAPSWAGIVASLPADFCVSSPATLLQQLLEDYPLRVKFLLHCFMPQRFYGNGLDRYPHQTRCMEKLLPKMKGNIRCLDAACGDGSSCYSLARILLEQGKSPELFRVEGWTLDPLECWSAAHCSFPQDRRKSGEYRKIVDVLVAGGGDASIIFKQTDLLDLRHEAGTFDLILCNGLLGGPILHGEPMVSSLVSRLAALLAPGGVLLVADNFHAGWKKKCPQSELRALFEKNSLMHFIAGEGIGGQRL